MMTFFTFVLLGVSACVPSLSHAHSAVMGGFPEGLWHPVLGLDHLLAMVSVGVVSAQMGGRAIWSVPSTFVCMMVVGGLAGMYTPPIIWQNIDLLIGIEIGIALSVLLLGVAIAMAGNISVLLTMAFVAFFGFCHGYAHGVEMPSLAVSWAYIAGFVLGTSFLHVCGVCIGVLRMKIPNGEVLLRYTGAAVAGIGVHILYLIYESVGTMVY